MTRALLADRLELGRATGLKLVNYRDEHVAERVRRMSEDVGVGGEAALARKLVTDASARARFRRSVAVSVTGLFRDPQQFSLLERELLPVLLRANRRLTVWSAGCADGSELQSVGLLLQRLGALERARLVGSDVLEENVHAATAKLRLADELYAARARFEQRDLLDGGVPPGSWRLIVCRNVAIYLAPHAKAALHETLARALARDGVLLLGRTERLHDPARLGLVRVAPNAYRRAECAT